MKVKAKHNVNTGKMYLKGGQIYDVDDLTGIEQFVEKLEEEKPPVKRTRKKKTEE